MTGATGPLPGTATGFISLEVQGKNGLEVINYKYTYVPPSNRIGDSLTDNDALNKLAIAVVKLYIKANLNPAEVTAYITLGNSSSTRSPSLSERHTVTELTVLKGKEDVTPEDTKLFERAGETQGTAKKVFEDFIDAYHSKSAAPLRSVTPPQTTPPAASKRGIGEEEKKENASSDHRPKVAGATEREEEGRETEKKVIQLPIPTKPATERSDEEKKNIAAFFKQADKIIFPDNADENVNAIINNLHSQLPTYQSTNKLPLELLLVQSFSNKNKEERAKIPPETFNALEDNQKALLAIFRYYCDLKQSLMNLS